MRSEQHGGEGAPWFTSGKNLLILVLAVVALVQGFLLFRQSPPPDLRPQQQKEALQATQEPGQKQQAGEQNATAGQETAPADTATAQVAENAAAGKTPPPETSPAAQANAPESEVSVHLAALTLEDDRRRYLLVSFDQPVGQERVGEIAQQQPAAFNPEQFGSWSWISPFTLRFDFDQPLPAGNEYHLELKPDIFLPEGYAFKGETWHTLRTRHFKVESLELSEDYAENEPGKVVVAGRIELSYPVKPAELLEHLRLTDPLRGKDEPVELQMQTTYQTQWLDFRSEPLVKEEQARSLTLTVEPGLQDATGELALTEPVTRSISLKLDPDLAVRKARAESGMGESRLVVTFSAPVEARNAGAFVQVAPEVDYSLSGSGQDLVLSGSFEPGREYVLTLEQGLTAADGAVLRTDYRETLAVPDLQPTVRFQDPGMFLPQQGRRALAVESVNAPKAKLLIDRVYTNNIFALLHEYSTSSFFNETGYTYGPRHYLGDRIVEKDVALPAPRNQVRESFLDLEQQVAGKGPGFYRVFLGLPDQWEGSQRWVLVTDLGIVAKKGQDDMLVWVNSFETLEAEAGVEVTLLSDQNQVIAQGETDAEGLWHAKGLAERFKEHDPYMVVAETSDDYSFLLLDQFKIDTAGQDVGGERVSDAGYMAYVYGERDIYRPGETLEGTVLLRRTDLSTPPSMPLVLLQKGPDGKELSRRVFRSDERGVAAFSYDIPDFALTGNYRLEVLAAETVIATYRYKVEEFLPDRIKVEIAPEKTAFTPGEELQYQVASRYFFGPPASELPVESKVRLEAAPFAPAGFETYGFGDPEAEFERRELAAGGPDARLDEEGERRFAVALPEDLRPPAALEAQIFARVSERGGRGVGAMQRVNVYPYPRYPGLKRLEDKGVDPGSRVQAEYVVLTPQGEETQGADLRLDFYKDRWQTVLRSTPSGGFRYDSVRDSRLLSSKRLENAPARGSFEVSPPEYGSYRLVLTDEAGGAVSQVSFFAGGWGYSPWAIENPARLDIVPDKDEYAPGEMATLQVRTPFAGKLLLTVEGETVHATKVVLLEEDANTATVELPMQAGYAPNVYVTGVLVREADGLKQGAPARAFGSVPLFVDREANKAPVTIHAPDSIRPETTLEVDVVTEPDAVVTLAAVDEGILQLIAQETPDPFARFYAKRALGTDSYDIFSMLFPDVQPVEGAAMVGGGGVDRLRQFVRSEGLRRVKPVAFWSGPLLTDAEGRVTTSFEVPEFQGALRLMAVVSKGRTFGSNHGLTRVRTPLVLTPTLPRFLSPGDSLRIPVTLRNDIKDNAAKGDNVFDLELAIEGQATATVSRASLEVPQGKEELVYFDVTVGEDPSGLRFTFSAQGRGERASASVDVPVRPALPARTREQSGALQAAQLELPLQAEGFRSHGLEREVHVGGLPLLRFSGGLRSLLAYPYGCLEQTVSRAFPLLYYDALAAALAPEDLDGRQPAAMVQAAISRMLPMQLPDGAFALWPGGDTAYPWGTLYATHFLLDARQAGFHVSDSVAELALQAVAELLRWKQQPGREDLERMAYAHFVLAKAGKPDRGGMDYLRKHFAGRLSPQAATLLAGAYGLLGDTRAMDATLALPKAPPSEGRQTGGNLNSPLRNTAMRLLVMLDTMPDDALTAQLVQQLVSLMEATPQRSTQENALAYTALGRFFHRQQTAQPFSGAVYLGDRLLGRFSSEKPLHKGGVTGEGAVRIELEGDFDPGSVFYSVLTRGVPTAEAYTPRSQGLALESRYLTREGGELPADGLAQGDLVVLETRIRALERPVQNVALQALLPAGLEVENPRLENTERLPWAQDVGATPQHQDLRDDRVLLFLDLPGPQTDDTANKDGWQTYYSLLRAVTPGAFALPPLQAEAMYDPGLLAAGEPGRLAVRSNYPEKVLEPAAQPEEPSGAAEPDASGEGGQDGQAQPASAADAAI